MVQRDSSSKRTTSSDDPQYNENEDFFAFFKRSWKFTGICFGILGIPAALKELSHRY